jgi:hypothetical protein
MGGEGTYIAKHAEENVDERIGRADATLNPYYDIMSVFTFLPNISRCLVEAPSVRGESLSRC